MVDLNLIKEHCKPFIEDLKYDLVDLEYIKEESDNFLRFYIGKKGGISIDDCQIVSEVLNKELDKIDPIEDSYYLEVSSPGLDRPLKTDKDLERNIGLKVELNLYKQIDDKKTFIGNLMSYDQDNITININGKDFIFNKKNISLIKLYIDI